MNISVSDTESIFFVVLLFLVHDAPVRAENCPQSQAYLPCSCNVVSGYKSVLCFDIKLEIVQKVFSELSRHVSDIWGVAIFNDKTTSLPSKLFGNVTLEKIKFYTSKVETVATDAFAGQGQSLESIEFSESSMRSIPGSSLQPLRKLQEFVFNDDEQLEVIKGNTFKNLASALTLSKLYIDDTNLKVIQSGAFSELTGLRKLSISDSKLTKISPDAFPPQMPKLMYLSLS